MSSTEQQHPVSAGGGERRVIVDAAGNTHLHARVIPLPTTVSAQARAYLSAERAPIPVRPDVNDHDAWRRWIAAANASFEPAVAELTATAEGRAGLTTIEVAGVTVHVGTPVAVAHRNRNRVMIAVHGGSLVYGSGGLARADAVVVAADHACLTWSVDYRVAPDHPFPAPLEDVVAVYRDLLGAYAPRDIAVTGVSAGGNIACAALLMAREAGLPLPGALLLNAPEVDLTESGDTAHVLNQVDGVCTPLMAENLVYAAGGDLVDPLLSPVFADYRPGFVPTLIQSGTRDMFLSNSVRLHRALRNAGIEAELHVWEGAPHGGFGPDAPETADVLAERERFLAKHWGS